MFKKKSLGQHFLHDPHYLRAVADAGEVKTHDRVLEIGPGDGALTRVLLERGAVVTAVEKDARLIPVLSERFGKAVAAERFFLREGDALKEEVMPETPYKLVANIPYYITGAIIEKFLTVRGQPESMTLLVQKEVAERIAREKKESILSLSVKAYGTPMYVKTVPSGAFSPPPSVDSAILTIKDISRNNFDDDAHEKKFFAVVHAGFAHKRKLLARNLEPVLGERALEMLQKTGIPEKARAEDVHLKDWLALSRN